MARPPFHVAVDQLGFALPDGRRLFAGVTLAFADERTGVVGANGTGKSTLARIVAGRVAPSDGSVTRHGTVGYLSQDAVPVAEVTVAEMLGIAGPLAALDRLLAGAGDAGDVERVGTQWDLRERATAMLARVGLAGVDVDRSLGMVSGGEGTRLALAALLLREPDLLVLDEPTNHLDASARVALARVLEEWPRGMLVISHDRAVLSRMDRIVELSSLGVRVYGGNYDAYRAQRDVEIAAAERELDAAHGAARRATREAQVTRERKARQDARGRRSRDDGSQPKLVLNARRERSQATGARLEADGARVVGEQRERLKAARERVEERATLAFAFPPTGLHPNKRVLQARGMAFAHAGRGAPLIEEFDLTLLGGDRVAVAGDNGAGKSTLLQLIDGELTPTAGELQLGVPRDRVARLDQKIAWPRPGGTLLENFLDYNPDASAGFARQALAAFLFRGDSALQPVQTLSGGESLRGAMAALLHAPLPPLLLLLDEPTNHLDLESLEAIERALRQYDGTLVVVSHDVVFLEAIGVTRVVRRDPSGRWR